MLNEQIKQQMKCLAMQVKLLLDKSLVAELLVLIFGQLDFLQRLLVFFQH